MTHSISLTLRPQSEIIYRDRSGPTVPVTEVAFIDPNVDDIDVLLAGLRPEVEAVLLNAVEPAARQMARIVARYRDLEAIHVIAHGAPGEIRFAAAVLSADCIDEQGTDLASVGQAVAVGAEIALWCCHAGAGARGANLVQRMSLATG